MPVQYVRVSPTVDLFSPAVRATGNIAIIGAAPTGTADVPVAINEPSEATTLFGAPYQGTPPGPVTLNSALTRAVHAVFRQSPGPNQVWAVKAGTSVATALTAVEKLDVQFVVLANTPFDATSGAANGAIDLLVKHVLSVSGAGDGKERMGVAMLPEGITSPALITGSFAKDRMVYIAHKSKDDAAAAVAGTIAGYAPHVSMVLKPVAIDSDSFTNAEIDAANGGAEDAKTGPKGAGLNWLVDPVLLPGRGIYLGEGYTGDPAGKKFIDITRTVDDISFKLKARLIKAIGDLRISRSGLRALTVQLEAVLGPLVTDGVIESYAVSIPVLSLLDADPATLTDAQLLIIKNAQDNRLAEVLVSVDYAGAMHRISINLKFV